MSTFKEWFHLNYAPFFTTKFLFLIRDQHGERRVLCETIDDLLIHACHLVTQRSQDGLYDHVPDAQRMLIDHAIQDHDGWLALSILCNRSDYDNEVVEWVLFDTI